MLTLFLGGAEPAFSQQEEEAFEPIWLALDLPIRIVVDDPGPLAKRAGISEELMQEVLEAGLSRNQIPLSGDMLDADCRAAIEAIEPGQKSSPPECGIPVSEFMGGLFGPVLRLSVSVLGIKVGKRNVGYAYRLRLVLSTFVVLNPADQFSPVSQGIDGSQVATAVLWNDWEIGLAGSDGELLTIIRSYLRRQARALSSDYLKAKFDAGRQ